MSKFYDVCVVGGGAGGIFSAILLAKSGKSVCILESNDRIGKKLLSTGNGRCNLSNANLSADFYNDSFVNIALQNFTFNDCKTTFKNFGLLTKTIENRLYPYSESASSVLNVLRANLEKYSVDVFCNNTVLNIKKNSYFVIECNERNFTAKSVIFATGSNATFGRNSHSLLSSLGHTYKNLRPSLCPMSVKDSSVKNLQGIRCDVIATLLNNGKIIGKERGEVLFKQNGLSGIVIFNLSSVLARLQCEDAKIILDFAPDFSLDELVSFAKNEIFVKFGFLHKNVISNILERGFESVKSYAIEVSPCKDFSQAQVLSGGFLTKEFFPHTLESTLCQNLYVIGEALNIDGDCGGYNLHWAWASANLAVNAILRK